MNRKLLTFIICWAMSAPALADKPTPTTSPAYTQTPKSVEQLRDIQNRVRKVVNECRAATVNLMMQRGTGSGVIVSEDGYILSAAHVVEEPGKIARVTLSNGKVVSATTLGVNYIMDSALLKISDEGKYPFRPIGTSGNLPTGQWVFALGHPLGLQPGRPPVLRIGRLLPRFDRFLRSDCTLVAGDSGGPLFDLDGNVVGIHSRISAPTDLNMHTPVDAYTKLWDRMANSEKIGDVPRPVLGINGTDGGRGFRVSEVDDGSPADIAGIEVDDYIISIDGDPVRAKNDLIAIFANHQAGDSVKVTLIRKGQRMTVDATLEPPPAG